MERTKHYLSEIYKAFDNVSIIFHNRFLYFATNSVIVQQIIQFTIMHKSKKTRNFTLERNTVLFINVII